MKNNILDLNLKDLEKLLLKGRIRFEYIKSNNDVRNSTGTLNPLLLPDNKTGGINIKGNLVYWEFNENKWKTISAIKNSFVTLLKYQPMNIQKHTLPKIAAAGIIEHDKLVELLNSSIVKFKYQKPDGSIKEAYGTTDPSRTNKVIKEATLTTQGYIPYFNIETDSWKTISASSKIELIDFFDVPLKK